MPCISDKNRVLKSQMSLRRRTRSHWEMATMAVQDWAQKKSVANKEKSKGGASKTDTKKGKGKGTEKFDTPCKWFQKGKCFKGDACPYIHTKAGS